jgi:hypothetical protein
MLPCNFTLFSPLHFSLHTPFRDGAVFMKKITSNVSKPRNELALPLPCCCDNFLRRVENFAWNEYDFSSHCCLATKIIMSHTRHFQLTPWKEFLVSFRSMERNSLSSHFGQGCDHLGRDRLGNVPGVYCNSIARAPFDENNTRCQIEWTRR